MRKSNNCSPAEGGRTGRKEDRRAGAPAGAGMRALSFLLALVLLLTISGGIAGTGAFAEDAASEAPGEQAEATIEERGETKKTSLTKVDDSFADDKWELILNQPALFHRMTYTDRETGLYIHYNIFLPEKYDKAAAYPLVLFLPDLTSTGTDPNLPLVQGIGGLVWTAKAWQEQFPAIVVVPLYREAILDHVYGYTTTGYVELTRNFVDFLRRDYAVDSSRIYGTGQGMGCEALMSIAAEDPDLFTACMFVSGQWDEKGVGYAYSIWNGDWEPYDRTLSGIKLTVSDTGHYFVFWRSGTIVADSDEAKQAAGLTMVNPAVHVASFNAAYRCVAVMEWLFSQAKVFYDVVK